MLLCELCIFCPCERKGFSMNQEIIHVPEIFGSDVFNESTMKKAAGAPGFCAWKSCIAGGSLWSYLWRTPLPRP